jgi:hypothetical protein
MGAWWPGGLSITSTSTASGAPLRRLDSSQRRPTLAKGGLAGHSE